MQANVLWDSEIYHSLESCLVKCNSKGCHVESTVAGTYEGKTYHVEYNIETNAFWETTSLQLKFQCNDSVKHHRLRKQNGQWLLNDAIQKQFDGCMEVDIPITPFTNTLPIKRLQLLPGQEEKIRVIYFNLLDNEIKVVEQKYVRLTESLYHYQNVPNDFDSDIEVDEFGLVVNYPTLFSRKEAFVSAHR